MLVEGSGIKRKRRPALNKFLDVNAALLDVDRKLKFFGSIFTSIKQLLNSSLLTMSAPIKNKRNLGYHKSVAITKCPDYDSQAIVVWDYENKKVDSLMEYEYCSTLDHMKRKSMMWLEKVKELAEWKEGETLYINTKSNSDGMFCCAWWKEKRVNCDIIIEPSGYACMKTMNNYNLETDMENCVYTVFYIRVDSEYNDKICQKDLREK
jgi:hypothetical protein